MQSDDFMTRFSDEVKWLSGEASLESITLWKIGFKEELSSSAVAFKLYLDEGMVDEEEDFLNDLAGE